MIDVSKLSINAKQKLPIQPNPYQQKQVTDVQAQPTGGNYDWSMPNWMGRGTYNWWQRNPDPGFGNPEQPWYRHPSWGDDAVYNPYYGYQNVRDITDLYGSGQDFWDWGLTQQLDPDWSQYGFERAGNQGRDTRRRDQFADPGGGDGSNWAEMPTQSIAELLQGLYNPNYSDLPYFPESDVGPGRGFQYPGQWGTASDVMTNFAYGDPTQVPWQWNQASQMGEEMSKTGMPTDITGYAQAQLPYLQDLFKQQADQAIESAGLAGLRQSTPLGYQLGDLSRQMVTQYGADIAGKQLSADEAARQRQLEAGGLLGTLGSGVAGLGESARNRALQAAGGLSGLGQQYLQAPQDWAQQMWGMGTQQQGIMQEELNRAYQNFMRMAPEYSPWLQQAMGYVGLQPQVAPQQYGQSGLGSLFGGLLGMLPFLGML